MTTLQSEIFEAFRSIGVPEDKALKAAEAFGKKDEDRFKAIDDRLDKVDARLVKLESRVAVLQWMMGFVLAFQFAIFVKLFLH
jgi:hypothetical protein